MLYLEIINCILTILSVFLLARENKIGWILSVIVCLTMAYIYYEKSLWYQFAIQFLFLYQSLLAYHKWGSIFEEKIKNAQTIYVMLFYLAISLFSLYWVKHELISYVDLILMFLSLAANHLLIFKKLSSWYLWFVYDIISIALCLYLDLYVTSLLFIVLAIICYIKIISRQLFV